MADNQSNLSQSQKEEGLLSSSKLPEGVIVIQEQGNFSTGGMVVTSERAFDPILPWTAAQGGQTRHGDYTYFIRYLLMPINILWCFFIEPDGFIFPINPNANSEQSFGGVLMEDFMKLTEIPIIVYYGDYIPEEETKIPS